MSFTSWIQGIQKRAFSSDKLKYQILGALLKSIFKYWWLLLAVMAISSAASVFISPGAYVKLIWFNVLNIIVFLTIDICSRLRDIFSLRHNDTAITGSYIVSLFSLLVWILCFLILYDVQDKDTKEKIEITATLGAIGAVTAWIFQDRIKGVVTYFHLRTHNLLNIGDWIQVPSKNVDGSVTKITLTSVTISNWDTTTSVIPINLLSTDHFINLQNMMKGKTYGRKMDKTFVLDTGWFHTLTGEDVARLKASGDVAQYLREEEIREGMSNSTLFRMYIYHWLAGHPHISLQPRLVIRWMEQQENGMPLQVYAFITDSGLVSYEWQQSQIIEHIIESLEWFGLRLYQSPSSYDVSNSNIYLAKEPATYRNDYYK